MCRYKDGLMDKQKDIFYVNVSTTLPFPSTREIHVFRPSPRATLPPWNQKTWNGRGASSTSWASSARWARRKTSSPPSWPAASLRYVYSGPPPHHAGSEFTLIGSPINFSSYTPARAAPLLRVIRPHYKVSAAGYQGKSPIKALLVNYLAAPLAVKRGESIFAVILLL